MTNDSITANAEITMIGNQDTINAPRLAVTELNSKVLSKIALLIITDNHTLFNFNTKFKGF